MPPKFCNRDPKEANKTLVSVQSIEEVCVVCVHFLECASLKCACCWSVRKTSGPQSLQRAMSDEK